MDENNFRIERITFDQETQIWAVQECIKTAQLALIYPAYKLSLKYFFSQPFYLIIYATICCMISIVINWTSNTNAIASLLVSIFGWTVFFLLIVYALHRKLWFWFINYVETESDLIIKNANKIYSKENNAFFAAYASNDKLISIGGILIDAEKQIYKEKYMSELSDNEAILVRIATIPEYQGKGASKNIIKHCIDFAKSKNIKCIKLSQTNKQIAAYGLYKKLGFKTTKKFLLITFINFYLRQMELCL